MKTKIKLVALVVGLVSLLPMTSAWAGSTYYARLTVALSGKSASGAGLVYAGGSESEAKTSTSATADGQGSDTTVTLWAYAKANRGFKFENWIAAQDGSGTPLSTDNPYACGIAASASKDDSSKRVPKTVYANFAVAPAVKVVFAAPDASNGDGYKYTADDGYDEYKVSDAVVGANGDEYNGFNSVKVTCTATHENAEGKILGWWMKDASGAQTRLSTEESFTQTFDKDVTVWPEFGKREKFFVTCVPAENGSYKVNDIEITDAERSVEGNDELQAKLVATPAKGYEFFRWYEVDGEGRTTYFADAKSAVDHKFNTGAQVGALFVERKRVEVTFDASASEDLVERTCDNAENDFSETDSGFVGYDSAKISLTAKGAAGRQAKWWYKTGNGEKVYFDISNATTITLTESAVVGVDFIMPDSALAKFLADAQSGDTITLDADADVLDGTEVTIPEGVTVVVPAEKTLFVDGKLIVSGMLTVEGTLSKCANLLKQTGNGLAPFNPYGSVKYWKTAPATANASVVGWGGTPATHVTIVRGDGVSLHKTYTGTPTHLYCTADPTVAANHVTSINSTSEITELTASESSSMPGGKDLGIAPSKSYTFIVLLTDDVKVTGHTRSGQTSLEITDVIDCAGRNISSTISKFYSAYNATFINGNKVDLADPSARSTEYKSGTARFVNCKTIGKLGSTKSHAYLGFYDCEISTLSIPRSDGDQCLIFCGGKYGFTFQDGNYKQDGEYPTRIYAGGFSPQPNSKYIAAELAASMEFHQHEDGYYYLEPKSDPNVASVDGVKYATFAEAFKCLQNQDQAVISLLRDASVDEMLTLSAGKTLTIDLNGCRIDAPDGFIANYGDLSIRDGGNRLTVSGVVATPEKCVIENFEGGCADICYGVYQGKFVVNGGTLTTHHGKFTGAIVKNGGTLRLKGGVFSSDVTNLLDEGYLAFPRGGLYYVGRFPKPDLSTVDIANTDIAFRLLAMPESDETLYVEKGAASLGADEDEWKYIAELNAAYKFFAGNFYIDILINSDRPIAEGSAKLTVKSGGLSFTQSIEDLPADKLTRVLSPRITMTQISYARFIDDDEDKWDNMEAGFSDVENANRGTKITLSMDLWNWHERHHTDPKKDQMDTFLTIINKPYVFGSGDNVAMLQAAEGPTPAENFFATLQGAVDAPATTEKTIKLCNDCDEDVTVGKTCMIDLNGFEFKGTITAGSGVTMAVEGNVYAFTKKESAVAEIQVTEDDGETTIAVEVDDEIEQRAKDEKKTVAEVLNTVEDNGLKVWENRALNDTSTVVSSQELVREVKNDQGETVTEKVKSPTADLPTGIYVERTTIKVENTNGETVEHTVEVKTARVQNDASADSVMVAVAGDTTKDNQPLTVANVIPDAAEGDVIQVYDKATELYRQWTRGENGWVGNSTVGGSGDIEEAGKPENCKLEAGQVFWYKRADKSDKSAITTVAVPKENIKVDVEQGTATKEAWTMVPNLSLNVNETGEAEGLDLDEVKDEQGEKPFEADQVIVPTEGISQRTYTFKNDKWGYNETKSITIGGRTLPQTKRIESGKLPANKNFWWVSGGGKPKIILNESKK